MPYAELLDVDARIELLLRRAEECQISDDHEARDRCVGHGARAAAQAADRTLEVVDALLGLDESYYTIGDNSHGTEFVDEAFALLEGAEPSPQLAVTLARRGAASAGEARRPLQRSPGYERALAMSRRSAEPMRSLPGRRAP